MSQDRLSRFELLAAAVLFSTGGAGIKATALTSWQVASFRSGIAALALLLLLPATRRNWSWRAVLVGAAYAATLILFVNANKMTTAANTIFLQATAPLYLLLLGPLLLKEPLRRSGLSLMAVLGLGMSLFFIGEQTPLDTAPDPSAGNVLALLSGLTWALTISGFRWLQSRDETVAAGLAATVAGNAVACLACLPMALPVLESGPADWFVVGYLGVFQIGLAYALLNRGMRHVPALEASLVLLAEPAFSPLWAWIVHGERPHNLALLGGAMILAGAAGSMLKKR
jgi:drug/metabolite transporter (DMT)-like permease